MIWCVFMPHSVDVSYSSVRCDIIMGKNITQNAESDIGGSQCLGRGWQIRRRTDQSRISVSTSARIGEVRQTCSAHVLIFVVCVFTVIVLIANVRHRYTRHGRLAWKRFLWIWTWVAANSQTFNNINCLSHYV